LPHPGKEGRGYNRIHKMRTEVIIAGNADLPVRKPPRLLPVCPVGGNDTISYGKETTQIISRPKTTSGNCGKKFKNRERGRASPKTTPGKRGAKKRRVTTRTD